MGEIVNLRSVRKQRARAAAADVAAANRARTGVSPATIRARKKAVTLAASKLDGAKLKPEPPKD